MHHLQSLYHEGKELICCWCAPFSQACPPVKVSSVTGDTRDFLIFKVDCLAVLLPRKVVKPAFYSGCGCFLKPNMRVYLASDSAGNTAALFYT